MTYGNVCKTFVNTPPLLPNFYVCPYADPVPNTDNDYSLSQVPNAQYAYDINLAFFTPSEQTNNLGNTSSDAYLCHLRDKSAIAQFVNEMKSQQRTIIVSFIDSPNVHWDSVNPTNFSRNTEGEILANGQWLTNDLMTTYQPQGRMWDIETPAATALATVMKACFLKGIQRDPDQYRFVYTTYANRDIDQQILNTKIDPNGDATDQALYKLGFQQISDFITLRGSLSYLETMSYSNSAESRFNEADAYALMLAKGQTDQISSMRKFISIGVAPGLTANDDALTIAKACNPNLAGAYGRFMVWAGNCPAGVSLFSSMMAAQTEKLPAKLALYRLFNKKDLKPDSKMSGNKQHIFPQHSFWRGLKNAFTCKSTPKSQTKKGYH